MKRFYDIYALQFQLKKWSFALVFLFTLGNTQAFAQGAIAPITACDTLDSLVLIDLLSENCLGCALEDPTSTSYWDLATPVSLWPGVVTIGGRITSLTITFVDLVHTLTDLSDLTALKKLTIEVCNLSGLPDLNGLPQLEELRVRGNQLTHLPDVSNLSNLKILYCGSNLIGALPNLDGLASLEMLHVGPNPLTSLPSLDMLHSLEELFADECQLTSLPGLDNLVNLKNLSCYHNQITLLPDLDALIHLEELHCEFNELGTIPSLGNTSELRILHLNDNFIESVPAINHLLELEEFNCSNNLLSSLPSMDNLPLIERIYCAGNRLTFLPDLTGLSTITILNCEENELDFADLEPYTSIPWLYYANQAEIEVADWDTVLVLDGIPVELDLAATGTGNNQFNWERNGVSVFSVNDEVLNLAHHATDGIYTCTITHPLFPGLTLNVKPVTVVHDRGVLCGNSNKDGVFNMLDLFALGIHYGKSGPARPDTILAWGDDALQPAFNWAEDFVWGTETINLKHADANGDGHLDSLDLGCMTERYTALELPGFLQSAVNDTISMRARPQLGGITAIDEHKVQIMYSIELKELPPGVDSIKVKGVIFTRPVAESTQYKVHQIFADIEESDFLEDMNNQVGMQVFHDSLMVNLGTGANYECVSLSVKPLDVGAFRKDHGVWMSEKQQFFRCGVVLEDIFALDNSDNSDLDYIPVLGHNYNVILITEDDDGNFTPLVARCESDLVHVNIVDLAADLEVSGAATNEWGDTLDWVEYHIECSRPDLDSVLAKQRGDYYFKCPAGYDYTIIPYKSRDLLFDAAVDMNDAHMVNLYLSGSISLTPTQLIKADVDRNGIINHTDYRLIAQAARTGPRVYPGGISWVFIDSDFVFPTPLSPFVFPSDRAVDVNMQQDALGYEEFDFIGLRLGDVDSGPAAKRGGDIANDTSFGENLRVEIYPNPVQDVASISFQLSEGGKVNFSLVDSRGMVVDKQTQFYEKGPHIRIWNNKTTQGGKLQPGVYMLLMESPQGVASKKLVLQ